LTAAREVFSGRLRSLAECEWTEILGWPSCRVYHHEINEEAKTLKPWMRCKRGRRALMWPGCGRRAKDTQEVCARQVRDLPCFESRTTVVIELYQLRRPDCGTRAEKDPQLPSKVPFSKRFEDAVGLVGESAPVRRVARR